MNRFKKGELVRTNQDLPLRRGANKKGDLVRLSGWGSKNIWESANGTWSGMVFETGEECYSFLGEAIPVKYLSKLKRIVIKV